MGADPDAEDLAASLSEPQRFAAVFERHAAGVHRYISYRLGAELADDLTAETFLLAFRGRANFDPARGAVTAWLFGIATNLVRHHRRDEWRRSRISRAAALAPRVDDDLAEGVTRREELRAAVARLDRGSRDVVLLVAGAGLSYEEAAAALSIPVGTVRSRLSRARSRLTAGSGTRIQLPAKGSDTR